jgi:hypothetical protein
MFINMFGIHVVGTRSLVFGLIFPDLDCVVLLLLDFQFFAVSWVSYYYSNPFIVISPKCL